MEFTPGLFNGLWTQGFKTVSQQLRNQVGLDPAPTAIVKILFVETRLNTFCIFAHSHMDTDHFGQLFQSSYLPSESKKLKVKTKKHFNSSIEIGMSCYF